VFVDFLEIVFEFLADLESPKKSRKTATLPPSLLDAVVSGSIPPGRAPAIALPGNGPSIT